jgi:ABC-type transport system involved in multi-copper enzyme maturation permease subunit
MKQIFNIFRKDLRRFWREIAVSLALLVMYSWNDARGWAGEGNVGYAGIGALISYQFLSGLVVVLLPIAWAFLIVRVIQGEALVGDRQFWITRPYEWKKLLAAKVLFVAFTINVPLLIGMSCSWRKRASLPRITSPVCYGCKC